MSKTNPTSMKTTEKPAVPHGQSSTARTVRETVESIVIAFILAFLFRTFEAEAFVIPTGSMAPTLQGRHKDVKCPKCGYMYRTGASEEMDREGNRKDGCNLTETICPMCRFPLKVDSKYPSYNGDRIIVSKFAYDLTDPDRWDVVVFKYPEDSKTNYIKRLVGLPNERLRIIEGDVYTAPLESNEFRIARKPPHKVRAMLQPVYDNDYVVPELIQAGMPPRWQPWAAPGQPNAWKPIADLKSFETDGQVPGQSWLRYQHILPTGAIWDAVDAGRPFTPPQPTTIKDFYAYNEGIFAGCDQQMSDSPHWVGDLALEIRLQVKSGGGAVVLELVKAGVQFHCRIDLATGQAKLSISALSDFTATANTAIRGPGTYSVRFANVDEQLLLWVNDEVVAFDSPTTYSHLHLSEPIEVLPVAGSNRATDLSPVGIAAEDGAAVNVSQLRISRDVYYIHVGDADKTYNLQADQFLMFGDNSPKSSDSRYWRIQNYVDRKLLIGKALFVYWPHSFNYVEVGEKKLPFPFWPNFARMRFVH
jgi:signal peptidase I